MHLVNVINTSTLWLNFVDARILLHHKNWGHNASERYTSEDGLFGFWIKLRILAVHEFSIGPIVKARKVAGVNNDVDFSGQFGFVPCSIFVDRQRNDVNKFIVRWRVVILP